MCVGHLYGVALYYGTCFFEYHYKGISHSRPEFLYYWVYYLGLNAAWVVVPAGEYLTSSDPGWTGTNHMSSSVSIQQCWENQLRYGLR